MNYSMTYTGLIVSVLGFLLNQFGIENTPEQLTQVAGAGSVIVGWIISLIGRYRQGDINIWGKKK